MTKKKEAFSPSSVLTLSDCNFTNLQNLLAKFQLEILVIPKSNEIPGSYWGESEAGIIGNKVYARKDTPIHSLLHECCHIICMDQSRRSQLNTDAAGDYDEENGVCFLQIILADDIPEMGMKRMMQDMDTWGYTFRLGSSEKWFSNDAQDTQQWLRSHNLLNDLNKASYTLRA